MKPFISLHLSRVFLGFTHKMVAFVCTELLGLTSIYDTFTGEEEFHLTFIILLGQLFLVTNEFVLIKRLKEALFVNALNFWLIFFDL